MKFTKTMIVLAALLAFSQSALAVDAGLVKKLGQWGVDAQALEQELADHLDRNVQIISVKRVLNPISYGAYAIHGDAPGRKIGLQIDSSIQVECRITKSKHHPQLNVSSCKNVKNLDASGFKMPYWLHIPTAAVSL